MKAILSLMVLSISFAAHSAVVQKSNADCNQQKKGALWEVTTAAPEQKKKSIPAPTQNASVKSKTRGA